MKPPERCVLALMRHGEYEQPSGVPSAHLPYALTERGRDQARGAAAGILAFALEGSLELDPVIDCSHLRRAWETASVLAEALLQRTGRHLEVREHEALAERSVGCAANLTVADIARIVSEDPRYPVPPAGWKRDPHYRLPLGGAESLMQAGQRVADHLRRLCDAPARPKLKLVVGHGGSLRHAAHQLGLLRQEQLPQLSMFHCVPVYVEALRGTSEAAELRFEQAGGEWKPRAQPDTFD